MNTAQRIAALMALLPLLVAGCATAPSEAPPAQPVPTALQLTITGAVEPILDTDGRGRVALLSEGTAEPISMEFENGTLAVQDLPPGQYSITNLGPLTCRGLTFAVDQSPRALGALQAEIVTTDYYVALMSQKPAAAAEIAELAERLQAAPEAIDARPIVLSETAPCFMGRGGPGTTWRERPLGEQIMFGVLIAGFCAAALASGGFCAF